ncbi:dephospho-CoA kinase [Psychroflexus aestuariivivens]|uniref:dephospho-CoA kinase n=1 Tax=Psychroflexus aestuariivivens TaxID=1795040 RepID=UPI000FD81416|nr:dephospho-CoA kinase [Psychroflexus aestuariivivens]
MIKVGLTGGIGSGKSTVAKMFQELGVPVFIADEEAKKIQKTKSVLEQMTAVFGQGILSENDDLDRKKLAEIVFNDDKALKTLNSIIHPEVHKAFMKWISKQNSEYIIYEAAIIFEKKRQDDFDFTILVTAPKQLRIQRVVARDSSNPNSVQSRISNQWSDAKKAKLADFVIENLDLKQTQQRVRELHEDISKLSDNSI